MTTFCRMPRDSSPGSERSFPFSSSSSSSGRARAGSAILLSSHLLHLVEEVCSRVIIMAGGKKIADGTFAELASRADLAEAGSNLEQIFLHVTGHDRPAESR